MPSATEAPALEMSDLRVAYRVRGRDREALHALSLKIGRGESYGLVGESGCGKSTAALAAMRYLPANGHIVGGSIKIRGRDLYQLSNQELRRLRANVVSMVYQDPGRALNPSLTVGRQIREVFEIGGRSAAESAAGARDMLRRVRIADPERVLDRYPHQLSGGMQQRVCIAMALASDPTLLILDEPTTGLDATIEAEVLDLIAQLRADFGASILFISHNLAVVAKMCDRVGILYGGELVKRARRGICLNRLGILIRRRYCNVCRARGSRRVAAGCRRFRAPCPRPARSSAAAPSPTAAPTRSRAAETKRRPCATSGGAARAVTIPSGSSHL